MIASDSQNGILAVATPSPTAIDATARRLRAGRMIAAVRNASPPPELSARSVLLLLILADLGYLLIVLDVGLVGGGR